MHSLSPTLQQHRVSIRPWRLLHRLPIVRFPLHYRARHLLLTAHRVYRHHAARHIQTPKQLGYRRYLVGVSLHLPLTQHETVRLCSLAHQVQHRLAYTRLAYTRLAYTRLAYTRLAYAFVPGAASMSCRLSLSPLPQSAYFETKPERLTWYSLQVLKYYIHPCVSHARANEPVSISKLFE